MKIYQINVTCGNGSTGKIAEQIGTAAQLAGDECRIAYGRGALSEYKNSIRVSESLDSYFHALMTRVNGRHGEYSNASTKKMISDIISYEPDVIHLHNIHGYYLNYRMLFDFLKSYGKPIVWTLHDCWPFTGHCAHFSYVECMQWKKKCIQCSQKSNYPACYGKENVEINFDHKMQAFTGMQHMTIVTPSRWLAEMVKKSFLKDYPIRVIYNSINANIFKPTQCDFKKQRGLETKKMILGVANAWSQRKGLDDFIALASILDENFVVVLVGLQPKQIKKLPKSIIGICKVSSGAELAGIYTEADVFVNPSYEETFGMTSIEAIACGTPVVAYNRTAVPEVVPANGGHIIEPGDIYGLKNAIESVISMKPLEYEDLIKPYQGDEQICKYLELYKEVAEE